MFYFEISFTYTKNIKTYSLSSVQCHALKSVLSPFITYTKVILHQNKNKCIRISQLAKIPTLFPDWWRSLIEEKW